MKELSAMLFINNKYTTWYYQIIESARTNPPCGYTEKHHIIPRSLGGEDDNKNIIVLSGRQHYICHLLLTKMIIGSGRYKMIRAAWMMGCSRKDKFITNRIYQYLKENIIVSDETRKKLSKSRLGRKLSDEQKAHLSKINSGKSLSNEHKQKIRQGLQKYKGIPRSEEIKQKLRGRKPIFSSTTREKMSESAKNRPPQQIASKIKRANSIKEQPKVSCLTCKKQLSSQMLDKHQKSKSCVVPKDRQWFTNGHEEKWLLISNGIPAGWRKGRCSTNLGRPVY